jgi:hypothetical protein
VINQASYNATGRATCFLLVHLALHASSLLPSVEEPEDQSTLRDCRYSVCWLDSVWLLANEQTSDLEVRVERLLCNPANVDRSEIMVLPRGLETIDLHGCCFEVLPPCLFCYTLNCLGRNPFCSCIRCISCSLVLLCFIARPASRRDFQRVETRRFEP